MSGQEGYCLKKRAGCVGPIIPEAGVNGNKKEDTQNPKKNVPS